MSNWLAITLGIDILRSPLGNPAAGELLMRKSSVTLWRSLLR